MESLIKDLSLYRLEKAKKNLAVARHLFEEEIYYVALNRAYYAIFDGMRAVNALERFDSGKHSSVIAFFNQHYVKTGAFAPETSSIIRRASLMREKSDYEDFFEPDRDDTELTLQEAEQFLHAVDDYLKAIFAQT